MPDLAGVLANAVSEARTVFCAYAYEARRNATAEPDGSWRWQIFRTDVVNTSGTPGGVSYLVGYIQSHLCLSKLNIVRLLAFDAANRPLTYDGAVHTDHEAWCYGSYASCLVQFGTV